jgi:hypothetical protein
MRRKMAIICTLGMLAGLLAKPVPSFASVVQVNLAGERSGGHYFADGDVIRPFAGTFIGDFTSEDCESAADQIHDRYEASGQRITLNASSQIELQNGRTMLVLGVENETANKWNYDCINIAATRTDTYFYRLGNGPYSSSGWVERAVVFNGSRYVLKFADNDHGAVVFAILG